MCTATSKAMRTNPDTVRPVRVRIGGDIDAVVTANTIRQGPGGVLYVAELQVVWWDGAERRQQWIEPWEVWAFEDAP